MLIVQLICYILYTTIERKTKNIFKLKHLMHYLSQLTDKILRDDPHN